MWRYFQWYIVYQSCGWSVYLRHVCHLSRLCRQYQLFIRSESLGKYKQRTEAVRSGFDPGNSFPWVVFYLKTHIILKFVSASQRPFSSLCEVLLWALRLKNGVAGRRCKEEACGDRATERISAGQRSNLRFVARRILANQLRPWSQVILAWLCISATRVLERQQNTIHANLSVVSNQWVGWVRALVEHQVTRLQYHRLFSVTSIWRTYPVVPPTRFFIFTIICMLHYYGIILHALVVSYIITQFQLKFLVLYTSLLN
jgi:hypothetical protein